MVKINFVSALLSILITLFVYRFLIPDVKPETMTDDVWWGRQSERTATIDGRVRPFRINISDKVIVDLKYRLANTRQLIEPLKNVHFEYGFNSQQLTKIVDYWLNRYDWTARQAYLNTLPQYMTRVYGLDVHFIHAKPRRNVRTVPLLMLHGWPGSVVEFYKIIPMLTDPRNSERDFAFEVVAPSLPGFGFSDGARKPGMGPAQMGQVFVKLMERLGHEKFYVQGGDWGAVITDAISKIFPDRIYGMHSSICIIPLSLCDFAQLALWKCWTSMMFGTEKDMSEKYTLGKLLSKSLGEAGYAHLQISKPDTTGVALDDSPVGLAAFILEKFSTGANYDNIYLPDGGLSKYNIDELLDNVMVYWVTGSMTTSMRLYSEYATKAYQSLPHIKAKVLVPTACAIFPKEALAPFQPSKHYKRKYVNLVSATKMEEGGHFSAFEQPKLLAEDIWSSVSKMEKN